MKYKLLALDIDGTIVKPHTHTPTQKVIDAIKKASEHIHVSLVSARAWEDLQPMIHQLGLRSFYHVIENGTKVVNPKGLLEHNKRLRVRDVKDIIGEIEGLYDEVAYCVDGKWLQQLPLFENDQVSTISAISYNDEKAKQIPMKIKELVTPYTVTVGAHWSNPNWRVSLISHNDASKGKGLSVIQQLTGSSSEETIAIGDGASDVSTMEYAGLKVAMSNAEPELLLVTNYTAPTVDEDGVAQIIERFILSQ
jgi:hypothetical protein